MEVTRSSSSQTCLNFSEVQVDYYHHAKHSYAVQIKSLCDQYDVPASRLRVELPETSLLKDLDVADF